MIKERVINLYKETELNSQEIAKEVGIKYKEVLEILKENKIPKKRGKKREKRKKIELTKEEREIVKEMKRELYTREQIANRLGIGERTLDRIAREEPEIFKYELRSHKKIAGKVKEIIEIYKEIKSVTKVAKQYNVDRDTIGRILNHHNIEINKRKNRQSNEPKRKDKKEGSGHWLYGTWGGIKNRCYNPNNKSYKNYGEKGIEIYNEWKTNFNEFKKYVEKNLGKKKAQETLDRINPERGYEPGNIRWADKTIQAYNKTDCFKRDLNKVDTQKVLKDKELGIRYYTIEELQKKEVIEELLNSGVYIVKCITNNNYYIGSTKRSFRKRWKEIRNHCRNDKTKVSKYIRKFWNECEGEKNFRFGVLEIVDKDIKKREQYWIDKLQPSLNIVKLVH